MLDKLDDTAAKKLFEQGILENFGKMTHFNAVPGGIVAYPTNGAEIFKWFADNHIKFDKKAKEIQSDKSPNSREEMCFKEYIKAVDPLLHTIKFDKTKKTEPRKTGTDKSVGKKRLRLSK